MSDLQATALDGGRKVIERNRVEALAASLRGALLEPGQSGYDEGRLLWNGMMDKRPALIARCEGIADVIASVKFARDNDILLAMRGGGHNVAGFGVCDGGLQIDLSRMKSIRVDPATRVVWVQGGASLGEMDRETQVFGLTVPAGVVSTTRVAG